MHVFSVQVHCGIPSFFVQLATNRGGGRSLLPCDHVRLAEEELHRRTPGSLRFCNIGASGLRARLRMGHSF